MGTTVRIAGNHSMLRDVCAVCTAVKIHHGQRLASDRLTEFRINTRAC